MPSATGSHTGSIELIGGHPALDLVNTVSWRHDTDRWRENLAVPLDLVTWARRAAVLDKHDLTAMRLALAEDAVTAERVLRQVHELREQLYAHLADRIDHPGGEHQIRDGSPLQRTLAEAVTASSLTGTPARWTRDVRGLLDIAPVLALSALDLLQTMPPDRIRRCDDDGCGWLFLDTTRNHSRRWCSSRDCGNRHRARRHYTRNRQQPVETRPSGPISRSADPPSTLGRLDPPPSARPSASRTA